MTKSKKRKTHHNNQHSSSATKNRGLSHAEIWDDSALIRSWNDAVAEYEYYHSIHARGEDVDEVLRQAEAAEEQTRSDIEANKRGLDHSEPDEGEIEDGEVEEQEEAKAEAEAEVPPPNNDQDRSHQHAKPLASDMSITAQDNQSRLTLTNSIPPAIDSAVDVDLKQTDMAPTEPLQINEDAAVSALEADQTLENIKMAYYWAGYYSGLYDGQRNAQCPVPGQGS